MNNKYGLDAEYFKKKMKLIVRDVDNYSPNEMFNELSRLSLVAATQADLNVKIDIKYGDKL